MIWNIITSLKNLWSSTLGRHQSDHKASEAQVSLVWPRDGEHMRGECSGSEPGGLGRTHIIWGSEKMVKGLRFILIEKERHEHFN